METTEIDASGRCKITYKTVSANKMAKSKSHCLSDDLLYVNHPDKLMATLTNSERHTTYTLNRNSLEEVTSNESHEMYMSINEDVGDKVETRQTLKLVKSKSSADLIKANNPEEILNFINSQKTFYTTESLLTENEPSSTKDVTFTNAIQENRDLLKSNLLGTLPSAKAFLKLIAIARQSSETDIAKALNIKKNQKIM